MKTTNFLRLGTMFLLALSCCFSAIAQENQVEKPKEARVKIHRKIDGKTIAIDTTIQLKDGLNIEEVIRQLGLTEDMNLENIGNIDIDVDADVLENAGVDDGEKIIRKRIIKKESDEKCCAKQANKPFLGVVLAEDYQGDGVLVSEVIEESAAAKAGLQTGDILTAINKTKVANYETLVTSLQAFKVNDEIKIKYNRANKKKKTKAVLQANSTMAKKSTDCESKCDKAKAYAHHFQKMNRPFLGVHLEKNEDEGTKKENGVLVSRVVENSAAAKAGLQQNDRIIKVENTTVNTPDELVNALKAYKIEDKVAITYVRANQTKTTTATLAAPHAPHHFEKHHHMERFHHMPNKALLGLVGVRSEEGLVITKIIDESGAKEAGLKIGDIIKSVNEEVVDNMRELASTIGKYNPADKVTIKFTRGGKAMNTTATLKENTYPHKQKMIIKGAGKEDIAEHFKENGIDVDKIILFKENEGTVPTRESKRIVIIIKDIEDIDKTTFKSSINNIDAKETVEVADLSFYPNPSDGKFALNFNISNTKNTTVRIVNASGKVIFTEAINNFKGNYTNDIDISDNKKGIYFLQIIQGSKVLTKKILVQ